MSDDFYYTLFPELQGCLDIEKINAALDSPLGKAYSSALLEFKKKKLMTVFGLEYQLNKIKSLQKVREYELSLKAEIKETVNPGRCMFITVNPKPGVSLETFQCVLHKFCSRAMFSRTLYCVEQRGTIEDDNLGVGFHAHILCCRSSGYPPNKIKKHTYSSFKHLVGNEASIDYGGRYCVIPNRQSYIIGTKKDPLKHPKQAADKKWRQDNGIEPYYGKLFS